MKTVLVVAAILLVCLAANAQQPLNVMTFNLRYDTQRDSANAWPYRKDIVITDDFNATPAQEPIQIITNEADPLHFTDSKAVCATPHYGPTGTFNGFKSKEESDIQ